MDIHTAIGYMILAAKAIVKICKVVYERSISQ